jgi:hypothetical protein
MAKAQFVDEKTASSYVGRNSPVEFLEVAPEATPVRKTRSAIDWTCVAEQCVGVHQSLYNDARFRKWREDGPQKSSSLDVYFVAAGVLTCAQSMLGSYLRLDGHDKDADKLEKEGCVHVQPMLDLASHYRTVYNLGDGQYLIAADLQSSLVRAVRLADRLTEWAMRPPLADAVRRASKAAWAPTAQEDGEFDLTVRMALERWARKKYIDDAIISADTPIFTGIDAAPAWFENLSEEDRDEIKWIFLERPNGEKEWVTRLNTIPLLFYDAADVPRPVSHRGRVRKWNAMDLDFDFDSDAACTKIQNSWDDPALALNRLLNADGRGDGFTQSATMTSSGLKPIRHFNS